MSGFKDYRRSIYLDFDYSKVTSGVSEVSKQMAVMNSDFRKQMEQANQTGNSLDKLGLKQEQLANQTRLQADKVDILRGQLEKLSNAENKNEKAIANKTIELNNAETALARLEDQLKAVNREVEQQSTRFGQAQAKLQDFVAGADAVGVSLDEWGGKFQKTGLAFASIGIAGAKFRGDFDNNMAKARTILDETQVSFSDLNKKVLETSNKFNKASADVADGLYQTLSSGIESSEAMYLLNDATLLAKTGFTDTSTAIDILTTMINSYGLSTKESTKLTDQLIMTQKLGKLTIDELGSSFGAIAGLAATAQLPLEQVQAAIATLTQAGVGASEAITGVRGVLAAVIKPTSQAQEEAKRLGLQFNLTALQSKGLSGFLEDVQKKTRGNSDSMAKLFGRVEGLNSMFILTGKGAENYAKNVQEITNANGTAKEAFDKLQVPSEKFSASINAMKNTLIEVGGAFAPVIDAISLLLKGISKIPTPLLVVISIAGALAFTVGSVMKAIVSASQVTSTFNTVFAGANLTMAKITITILGVASALALVLGLLTVLTGKGGEASSLIDSILGKTNKQVEDIKKNAQQAPRNVQGSHATGLRRVPHDRYVAELHKDEAIIPASQNPYVNGNGGFGGDTINITIDAKNVDDFNQVIRMAKEYKQTSRAYGRG